MPDLATALPMLAALLVIGAFAGVVGGLLGVGGGIVLVPAFFYAFGHLGYGDTITRGGLSNQMGADLPFVDLGSEAAVWKLSGNGGNPPLKFNCALLLNGQIKCWGANTDGNLGYGDTIQRGDHSAEMGADLPNIDLGTNKRAIDLAVGSRFACALLSSGNQVCWGYNVAGSHGNNVKAVSYKQLTVPTNDIG